MNWRFWPGTRVRLVNRTATVLRRLPFQHVEVRVDGSGRIETWWRGNLRLVL